MNYSSICPICQEESQLHIFKWANNDIIQCKNCELNFCGEMSEKESGGNSSPVDKKGIMMMSDMFHNTFKIAMNFSIKRKFYYENLLNRKCKNILEIGCGPGVFYKPWSRLNVHWTGIEINPYWKTFGEENGIPISIKPIDSLKIKYDVITAHQVLEHVEDPLSFLKSIIPLLNPNGIIHFELPNHNSFTSRLRKISPIISSHYGFIQPPMHLRAYNKKTIKILFNSLNLQSKLIFICGNTDKTWGQVRKYSLIQKSLYYSTNKIGMGSLLIGIAQLKSSK